MEKLKVKYHRERSMSICEKIHLVYDEGKIIREIFTIMLGHKLTITIEDIKIVFDYLNIPISIPEIEVLIFGIPQQKNGSFYIQEFIDLFLQRDFIEEKKYMPRKECVEEVKNAMKIFERNASPGQIYISDFERAFTMYANNSFKGVRMTKEQSQALVDRIIHIAQPSEVDLHRQSFNYNNFLDRMLKDKEK